MAPAVAPIRNLLTSFSPDADSVTAATANSLLLPLAQVWDAARGRLQTEFADIPSVEVGAAAEAKRGHLALDYTCMKWVQLSNKKKRKAGSSLLVLGTGSGDVLALDVAGAQWKWRVSDCHPGGVTAVAYSKHGRCVYTAGTDGMVYGKILATAAGQLRTFDTSDNKKMKKFSGHPMKEDYTFLLFLRLVSAISGLGIMWMTCANKKPTKIALSKSSLARPQQAFSIFAAKLQGVDGPDSAHVLLAYGSVVKPSFDKLLVCHGTDINLDISQDGVLLPNIQTTMPTKGQSAKKQETVTALDRANAEDATLPLPKLHTQEKKRKHAETKPSGDVEPTKPSGDVEPTKPSGDVEPAIDTDITTARLIPKRVPVQRIEDDSIRIEDMMKECGVIDNRVDQSLEDYPGVPTNILSDLFGSGSIKINADLPSKKIRAHLRLLKPKDACKLLDSLVSAWKTRSGRSELVLRWIYCLLVIHGRFIPTDKSRKLIGSLEKMCVERYSATEDLLQLSGRLRLIVAQVDKNASVSDPPTEEMQDADAAAVQSDEEDDEEIDETVFGQDSDLSQTSDDDAE
ncbi:hypothetical protein PR202_ga26018 [Eleusine coracana subsp. coracana]|uniref:Small-subunit processome Utp12 domain-containing protein n=1 Tax=Eleusine coracana subsp. coracana TaxID=191504 RepID=A0AAV5DD03_ELECO|nr:hypothetical protein PR202_ga26018 [Eleusine coracana subsp. coracana]